ncbi:MAG: inositol monophosphatase [Planctomycetota bacterium]|nr:inositol monophosphatase [Planctomycetota bacterium]
MSADLQLAAEAAFFAGEIIRQGYQGLHTIHSKGIGDFVSNIDERADEAACQILKKDPLQFPILSEELSPEVHTDPNNLWIVDPLDGTSAFLFQTGPHFSSVLIARRQQGENQLGVVYFPVTGEWFYAEKGQGAYQDGKPLKSDQQCSLNSGWVELNAYGDSSFETNVFALLRKQLRTAKGAALVTQSAPYSGVAMRIADPQTQLVAAIHDNCQANVKQAAWDIAAPQCVLEEAGGVVMTLEGNPVDPFRAEPFLVAANPGVAESIRDLRD